MFSIIAQLKKVIASNDRGATSQFLNWHPFLLDLYKDFNNLPQSRADEVFQDNEEDTQADADLHQHIEDSAALNNPKLPDEDTSRPAAPDPSASTSVSPRNSLTLGIIEGSQSLQRTRRHQRPQGTPIGHFPQEPQLNILRVYCPPDHRTTR